MHKVYVPVVVVLGIGLLTSLAGLHSVRTEARALREQTAPAAKGATKTARHEPASVVVITQLVTELADAAPRDNGELEQLRAELNARDDTIQELRTRLETRQSETNAAPSRRDRRGDRGPGQWMERMQQQAEEMRKNDPERYEQIQQEEKERRARVMNTMADQYSFIFGLDPARMTDEQYINHTNLTVLLEESWRQMEILDTETDPGLQTQARMVLMHNMRRAGPLLDSARTVALYQVGQDLGYNDTEAADFARTMTDVYNMTSVGTYFRDLAGGHSRRGGQRRREQSAPSEPTDNSR